MLIPFSLLGSTTALEQRRCARPPVICAFLTPAPLSKRGLLHLFLLEPCDSGKWGVMFHEKDRPHGAAALLSALEAAHAPLWHSSADSSCGLHPAVMIITRPGQSPSFSLCVPCLYMYTPSTAQPCTMRLPARLTLSGHLPPSPLPSSSSSSSSLSLSCPQDGPRRASD